MANPNKIKNGGTGTFAGKLLRGQLGGSFGIPKATPVAPALKPLPSFGAPKKPVSVITTNPAKGVVKDIQSTINSSNNAPRGSLADFDSKRSALEASIKDIQAGNLSPSEQKMLDNSRSIMSSEIENQKLENKRYEAEVNMAGIRSGRNRYAPDIQGGFQDTAVSDGIAKVQRLNIEMESKISEMQEKIKAGKIKEARDSYNDYNDYIKERRSLIKSIATGAADGKAYKTASFLREYDKYKQGNGTLSQADFAITRDGAEAAVASPVTITQEYADQYGLPASLVGTSTADIVQSLTSSEVPDWFTQSYAENAIGYNTQPGMETQALQTAWNQFRQDPTVLASAPLPTTSGATSTPSGNSSSDDIDYLINALD